MRREKHRPVRQCKTTLEEMLDGKRKAIWNVHVKRELVLCVEVGVGQVSVHLGVGPRDGEADARQHVIGGDPIDVVLVDFGPDHHAVLVLVLFPLPLARALLADVLGPSLSVLVLGQLLAMVVRVDGAGASSW